MSRRTMRGAGTKRRTRQCRRRRAGTSWAQGARSCCRAAGSRPSPPRSRRRGRQRSARPRPSRRSRAASSSGAPSGRRGRRGAAGRAGCCCCGRGSRCRPPQRRAAHRHQAVVGDDRDEIAREPGRDDRRARAGGVQREHPTSSAYETSQSARATEDGVDHGSKSDGKATSCSPIAAKASHVAADRMSASAPSRPPSSLPSDERYESDVEEDHGVELEGRVAGDGSLGARGARAAPRRSAGRTAGRSRPGARASRPRPRRRGGRSGRTSARRRRRRRGSGASRRDLGAREAVRVAGAVPALVVVQHVRVDRREAEAAQRARSRSPSAARPARARRRSAAPACSGCARARRSSRRRAAAPRGGRARAPRPRRRAAAPARR